MITVTTPAGFEWTTTNGHWVRNYLLSKTNLLIKVTNHTWDINQINEFDFIQLCKQLELSAEGRELRNKMFKAWRSKKSRDSDNGKKLYTFNLSIEAGLQLKKLAKEAPLNKTLESLILAGNNKTNEACQQQIHNISMSNKQSVSATAQDEITNENDEIDALINQNLQVAELAKLEKSQLIKQILLLKRKLNIS